MLTNKYFYTRLSRALCYALSRAGYASIWPLFGSANQLLSALALIACAVFLKTTHRQGVMLWGPMVIMLGVTFTAVSYTHLDVYKRQDFYHTSHCQQPQWADFFH